jgi:hypothetical protein
MIVTLEQLNLAELRSLCWNYKLTPSYNADDMRDQIRAHRPEAPKQAPLFFSEESSATPVFAPRESLPSGGMGPGRGA